MWSEDSMDALIDLTGAANQGDLDRVRGILETDEKLVNRKDESGATALHYAAMNGHRSIVQLLLERGADINSTDSRFGASPACWAVEYLRERGAHLAIELDDLAYAIRLGDARWVRRFLERFPALRLAKDLQGTPFREIARQSANREIAELFQVEEVC